MMEITAEIRVCDRVTGTDISEQMIQVCKEEYRY